MKSGLFILIVCLLFPAYVCADTSKHALEENRKLLHSLDSLLEQQDLFVRVKEERIKQLKMQYSRVKDVKELYAMNRMVYLEYRVYDADSALHYINKNIQLAQQTNNRTWEVVSLLEQSFVLTSSGLLTEALKAVSDIQPEELPQNLRSEYFGRLCTLYSRLRDYSSENSQLSEHYNNLQKAFRDSVYLTATPDELRYWNCRAWLYLGTPEIEPVKQAFEENKQTLSNDSRKYSIATYNLSAIYRSENNESKYLENLILSAMADIRSVNGDIGSLQEIAEYLFKHGEIDRAYNYILYCSQKAFPQPGTNSQNVSFAKPNLQSIPGTEPHTAKAPSSLPDCRQFLIPRTDRRPPVHPQTNAPAKRSQLEVRQYKPEVVRQYGCPLYSTSTPGRSKHAAERPEYAITGSQRPVAGI